MKKHYFRSVFATVCSLSLSLNGATCFAVECNPELKVMALESVIRNLSQADSKAELNKDDFAKTAKSVQGREALIKYGKTPTSKKRIEALSAVIKALGDKNEASLCVSDFKLAVKTSQGREAMLEYGKISDAKLKVEALQSIICYWGYDGNRCYNGITDISFYKVAQSHQGQEALVEYGRIAGVTRQVEALAMVMRVIAGKNYDAPINADIFKQVAKTKRGRRILDIYGRAPTVYNEYKKLAFEAIIRALNNSDDEPKIDKKVFENVAKTDNGREVLIAYARNPVVSDKARIEATESVICELANVDNKTEVNSEIFNKVAKIPQGQNVLTAYGKVLTATKRIEALEAVIKAMADVGNTYPMDSKIFEKTSKTQLGREALIEYGKIVNID